MDEQIEVFDFIGSVNVFAVHPSEQLVAFEQGNSLLLWDLFSDKKVRMHQHDNEICCIMFLKEGNLLASTSAGVKSQIFISDWNQLERKFNVYLPSSHRKEKLIQTFLGYIEHKSILIVIEVETKGYRLLTFFILQNELKLIFISELDLLCSCQGLLCFNSEPMIKIATLEDEYVKLWTLDNTKAILTNRIKFQNEILGATINQVHNLIIVITSQGAMCIINEEGELISQIKSDQYFLSVSAWDSYILVGCKSGSTVIYEASTLNYVKIIDTHPETIKFKQGTAKQKSKASLNQLASSQHGELIVCSFSDGTFCAFANDKEQLIGYQKGHTGKVNQICWNDLTGESFFTISNDGILGEITLNLDKVDYKGYEISQGTEKQLANLIQMRINLVKKNPMNSIHQKIKSIALNHYRKEIYLGDNKGQLMIYSMTDFEFVKAVSLADFMSIQVLKFSPAYQYLAVVLKSGFTMILDCENNLKPQLKLEDHLQDLAMRTWFYKGVVLFQNEYEIIKNDYLNLKLFPKIFSIDNQYQIPRQDKNFASLTLYDIKSIRLHQIVKSGQTLSALALCIYQVDSLITGFDIHPSKDYVFILSVTGYVNIFQLQTGGIKGKVKVLIMSKHLTIDPSGLFFALACFHAKQDRKTLQYNFKNGIFQNKDPLLKVIYNQDNIEQKFISNNLKLLPTNLRIYECGTGNLAAEVKCICNITSLEFSPTGDYIVCGGKKGKVSIWSCAEEMVDSIKDVLSQMKVNQFFWKDYPINIDDLDGGLYHEQEQLDYQILMF